MDKLNEIVEIYIYNYLKTVDGDLAELWKNERKIENPKEAALTIQDVFKVFILLGRELLIDEQGNACVESGSPEASEAAEKDSASEGSTHDNELQITETCRMNIEPSDDVPIATSDDSDYVPTDCSPEEDNSEEDTKNAEGRDSSSKDSNSDSSDDASDDDQVAEIKKFHDELLIGLERHQLSKRSAPSAEEDDSDEESPPAKKKLSNCMVVARVKKRDGNDKKSSSFSVQKKNKQKLKLQANADNDENDVNASNNRKKFGVRHSFGGFDKTPGRDGGKRKRLISLSGFLKSSE